MRKSRFCILATDGQTNKQTDEQMDSVDALSRSRCCEWRLHNIIIGVVVLNLPASMKAMRLHGQDQQHKTLQQERQMCPANDRVAGRCCWASAWPGGTTKTWGDWITTTCCRCCGCSGTVALVELHAGQYATVSYPGADGISWDGSICTSCGIKLTNVVGCSASFIFVSSLAVYGGGGSSDMALQAVPPHNQWWARLTTAVTNYWLGL